jgi:hypothetical protein
MIVLPAVRAVATDKGSVGTGLGMTLSIGAAGPPRSELVTLEC